MRVTNFRWRERFAFWVRIDRRGMLALATGGFSYSRRRETVQVGPLRGPFRRRSAFRFRRYSAPRFCSRGRVRRVGFRRRSESEEGEHDNAWSLAASDRACSARRSEWPVRVWLFVDTADGAR